MAMVRAASRDPIHRAFLIAVRYQRDAEPLFPSITGWPYVLRHCSGGRKTRTRFQFIIQKQILETCLKILTPF